MKDINLKNVLLTALLFLGMVASFIADAAPTVCNQYNWSAPTTRMDGSVYDHSTGGYRFYGQQTDGTLVMLTDIPFGTTTISIQNLFQSDGKHIAGISAYDSDGLESPITWATGINIQGGIAYYSATPVQPGTLTLSCTVN